MKIRTMILATCAFVLGIACSDGADDPQENNSSSNNTQVSLCTRACQVLGPCAGVTQAMCEAQCPQLSSSVLQCAADAASCAAVDQCASQPPADMGSQQDMGVQDMDEVNPDPCSRCGATQVCVQDLANESKTCKDTIQSCNDKQFPDVCDCLLDDALGQATPDGRSLCPRNGVAWCGERNAPGATYLQVDCRR